MDVSNELTKKHAQLTENRTKHDCDRNGIRTVSQESLEWIQVRTSGSRRWREKGSQGTAKLELIRVLS